MKTYQLTLNEEQARVLTQALDLYARIGCGQLEEILQHHQFRVDYAQSELARERIQQAKLILTSLPETAYFSIHSPDICSAYRVAFDLKQVIRHRLAWDNNPQGGILVNFDTPVQTAKDTPLATMVRQEDNDL